MGRNRLDGLFACVHTIALYANGNATIFKRCCPAELNWAIPLPESNYCQFPVKAIAVKAIASMAGRSVR
jgi:hypothetical protein